jgi:hypothetical protein
MVSAPVTLRIRGTFIDFYPEMKEGFGKIRSTSAPPRSHFSKTDETETYLCNLIEQTRSLPQVYLSLKQRHAAGLVDDEHSVDPESSDAGSTASPPMTASMSSASEFESDGEEKGPPITTLMICDMPCRTSECDVVDMLAKLGFAGKYDFLFVPSKKRGRGNQGCLGYAFVNFMLPQDASRFAIVFDNFSFPGAKSTKLGYVKPALIQGYAANYKMRKPSKWFQKHRRAAREETQ